MSERAVKNLLQTAKLLRRVDPAMPMQQFHVLLFVYQNPLVPHGRIGQALRLRTSAVSRIVDRLSRRMKSGDKGLGLVSTTTNPGRPSTRLVTLTPKGKRLIAEVCAVYGPESGIVPPEGTWS